MQVILDFASFSSSRIEWRDSVQMAVVMISVCAILTCIKDSFFFIITIIVIIIVIIIK